MSEFKKFAKFLLLAQTASDGGKGMGNSAHNGEIASKAGYGLKDDYIQQAIAAAQKCSNVRVEQETDDSFYGMNVIYFTINGWGQVSFHSFSTFSIPQTGVWKGQRGESAKVCRNLNQKLNLQHYG